MASTSVRITSLEQTSLLLTQNQNKMCLDPSTLVRRMSLLDSKLQEQVGCMDVVNPLRAMYAEHCRSPDSNTVFTPRSYPLLSCSPRGEFLFVVGEDGIDQEEWKLKGGALPTCGSGSMVEGRNDKSLDELVTAPEAQAANLVPEEIVALRLCSGPLRHVYNAILGQLSSELLTSRNTYPTTIALVVSAIKKLSAVAKAPAGGAVWRSLASGVGLPDAFFERDEQGFAWGMDTGFMATSRDETVALKCSEGEGEGEGRTVFKIMLGKMSLGADIAWLSQFEGEAEMLFPPRTQLQIVAVVGDDGVATLKPVVGDNGVAVVTLKPALFQDISTVEEVKSARKEGLRQLTSSLMWDLRTEADRDKELTPALVQRIDQLELHLLAKYGKSEPGWYNENLKYKQAFQSLIHEATEAKKTIRDASSPLCKGLAAFGEPTCVQPTVAPVAADLFDAAPAAPSNEVSVLHSKYTQDPNFKGVRGKFGNDKMFVEGLEAIVGPMDVQFERSMYKEHCMSSDADSFFKAYNAGHEIKTSPCEEWVFVVGKKGLNLRSWTFVPAESVPLVLRALQSGRNAKCLADLLDTLEARAANLSAAEVVALRLYTGPMYVKYNAVLRGLVTGGNRYAATIYLVCSGLRKLSRKIKLPEALMVYRGNGGMALPLDFLEPDTQGCAGGVERALMSTTPKREVALGYSGLATGKELPTLFEIAVDKFSTGASIAFLSQFEGEEEILYAPLTFLEVIDLPQVELHGGKELSVVRLQMTVNQKTATVEQVERSRCVFLEELANNLVWEARHWANKNQLARLLPAIEVMRARLQAVAATDARMLNENTAFAEAFGRVLGTSEDDRVSLVETVWEYGLQARERGDVKEAVMLFEAAIDGRGKGLCDDNKEGRDQVVEMRGKLLALRGEAGGAGGVEDEYNKMKVAGDKFALAADLKDRGDYDEALALYDEALVLYTEAQGHDSISVASTYNNMGVVYEKQVLYEKALEYYQKDLEITVRVVGHDHLSVASTYNNIADVYESQGKYDEALVEYQKSLDIKIRVVGHVHLDVAKTYNNIAVVYQSQGKYDEALVEYQKSLDIMIRLVGHVHLSVAVTYNNIGEVYRQQCKYDEALVEYQKSLDIKIRVVGHVHLSVAGTYNNIAGVYQHQGKYDEALVEFQKSLDIKIRVVGHVHPLVATSKYNIAGVNEVQGNLEEARQLFLECEQIYSKVYGPQHEETVDAARRAATVGEE